MIEQTPFFALCEEIFHKNSLDAFVTEPILEKFLSLTELMLETNARMNITALTTLDKIIPLHYADCIKAAAWIPVGASVLDVGCGGGFPLLPLAIVRPDLHLTGLDATEKKIRYVQATANALGLSIHTVSGRAEDLAKNAAYREQYDIVISRAVARLNVLDELCAPFVKPGGRFIAMKGAAGQEECDEAASGLQTLGCRIDEICAYTLYTDDDAEKRVTVLTAKERGTPAAYPRAFGVIKKKPL